MTGRSATVTSFLLVTGSTLVGGLLNAALIALAARRGEISEIAAYTVMMAVLAIVGVAVGGGASMLYLSGTDGERLAVRSQRVLVILPSLVLVALAVVLFYGSRGYASEALAATAGVFVANNLAELPLAQLHRDLRFRRIVVPTLLSKVVALAVFVPGAPATSALLAGAVVNLALFELLAGAHSPLRAMRREPPTMASARGAFRSGRGLYLYTLAELFALRVPSVGLSLSVPLTVMGSFGAVATAFQALLSVFQSGLNMVLSLRARAHTGAGVRGGPDTELMSLGAGVLGATVIGFSAPWLTTSVLSLNEPGAATWLRILGLALPFYLVNRIIATRAIATGRHTRAARIAVGLAVVATVTLVVAIPAAGVTGGPLATLVSEAMVATTVLVTVRLRAGTRSTKPDRTGPARG